MGMLAGDLDDGSRMFAGDLVVGGAEPTLHLVGCLAKQRLRIRLVLLFAPLAASCEISLRLARRGETGLGLARRVGKSAQPAQLCWKRKQPANARLKPFEIASGLEEDAKVGNFGHHPPRNERRAQTVTVRDEPVPPDVAGAIHRVASVICMMAGLVAIVAAVPAGLLNVRKCPSDPVVESFEPVSAIVAPPKVPSTWKLRSARSGRWTGTQVSVSPIGPHVMMTASMPPEGPRTFLKVGEMTAMRHPIAVK
jgi:hypothetical protein